MIVGAAVCPGAPLLVTGLADALARSADGLPQSCSVAIGSLAGADRLLLITSGPRALDLAGPVTRASVIHPPGTCVTSAQLTDSALPPIFRGRLPGGGAPEILTAPVDGAFETALPGLGVVVGAALLAQAGIQVPTTAIELAVPAPRTEPDAVDPALDLMAAAALTTDRVALLVIADGSAGRGADAPGGDLDGARTLDAALAAALASGSPQALAAAVRSGSADAGVLLFTSGPAFAALAEVTAPSAPARATLLYDRAPYGVGYLVAAWYW